MNDMKKIKNILKTILAITTITGVSSLSSSAFAGLQLISTDANINAKTTVVQCPAGSMKIPAIFNTNVAWGVVKMVFLHGMSNTCTFSTNGVVLGTGTLTVSNDMTTATVTNVTSSEHYAVSVSGSGTANVNITLSDK